MVAILLLAIMILTTHAIDFIRLFSGGHCLQVDHDRARTKMIELQITGGKEIFNTRQLKRASSEITVQPLIQSAMIKV
jgi:hypothetical protein